MRITLEDFQRFGNGKLLRRKCCHSNFWNKIRSYWNYYTATFLWFPAYTRSHTSITLCLFVFIAFIDSPTAEGPRVVIPKLFAKNILFWKLVFPWGGFGPSVAHGKHSVRRRCVQATEKQGRNLLSPLTPLGAVRAAAEGSGYKNRGLGKSRGIRFDSRLVWSVRCDTLWAWNGCSVFLLALLNVCGNTHAVSLLHAS